MIFFISATPPVTAEKWIKSASTYEAIKRASDVLPHPGGYLFLLCLGFFILLLCLEVDPWLALIGALAYGLSTYFLSIIQAGHNSKANALAICQHLLVVLC